jgi:hypothetical protein
MMDRLVLSDAAWDRLAPLILGRPDQKRPTGRDNRNPSRALKYQAATRFEKTSAGAKGRHTRGQCSEPKHTLCSLLMRRRNFQAFLDRPS